MQYAAVDAAVTGSHILDWVLVELSEEAYLRLTGIRRGQELPKGDPGPIMRFINLNKDELGGIDYCRSISNAMKHMKMSLGQPMKGMGIGSTAKLKYTDNVITGVEVIAYIEIEVGKKVNAIELFEETAEQWREFLVREGLWVEQPPEWDE